MKLRPSWWKSCFNSIKFLFNIGKKKPLLICGSVYQAEPEDAMVVIQRAINSATQIIDKLKMKIGLLKSS